MKIGLKIVFLAALCLGTYSCADIAKEDIYIKTNYGIKLFDEDRVVIDCTYTPGKQFLFFDKEIYSSDELENLLFSEICDKEKNKKQEFKISELKELTRTLNEDDGYIVSFSGSIVNYEKSFLKIKEKMNKTEIKSLDLKKEDVGVLISIKKYSWVMYKNRSNFFKISKFSFPRVIFLNEIREVPSKKITLIEEHKMEITNVVMDDKKVKFIFKDPITLKAKSFTNTYDINEIKECIDGKVWIKKYKGMSGDKCPWVELIKQEVIND